MERDVDEILFFVVLFGFVGCCLLTVVVGVLLNIFTLLKERLPND